MAELLAELTTRARNLAPAERAQLAELLLASLQG
jgi:hypothetical protein